jgi:hypothetical protein
MNLGLLFLVAFFWGTSNPMMKKVTADLPKDSGQELSFVSHAYQLLRKYVLSISRTHASGGNLLRRSCTTEPAL